MDKEIGFNGQFSNEYDSLADKIIPAYQSIYELAQYLLRDRLRAQAKILVAGSGTGKEIIDWAQNNSKWSFTGFDPAKPMHTVAKRKISAACLEERITLIQGQIHDVTEKDFDAATTILVMHFLPDNGTKLKFLKSLADKLKSGAPLVLVDLEGDMGSDEFKVLNSAWKNHQISIRNDNEKVEEEFLMREKEVHFISQKRIESLLKQAGFVKTHKFFKAYLFGGYIAEKK